MKPDRLYSAMLALYPTAFRRLYGEAMTDAFRQMYGANRRTPFGFWLFILADLCGSACREHIDACRSGVRRFVLQWVALCAAAVIVTGVLANALTWSFGYLYHPYLEGVVLAPWSYGAFLGLGVGLVQSAALRHRLHLGAGWILVTAASTAFGLQMAVRVPNATGPVDYGIVLGTFVGSGQWLILRTRIQGAGWWALASAVALPAGVLSCDAVIHRTLRGMNPLPNESLTIQAHAGYREALDVLVRGLYRPRNWTEVAVELAAMAISGLVIGAVTAKPLSTMVSRHQ